MKLSVDPTQPDHAQGRQPFFAVRRTIDESVGIGDGWRRMLLLD
jgi:hypothetical protein